MRLVLLLLMVMMVKVVAGSEDVWLAVGIVGRAHAVIV